MMVSLCRIKHSHALNLRYHYWIIPSLVITCSKAPENATVTEGEIANLTIVCSGGYQFDFTLFLDTMDGSAVGEC